MDKDVLMNILNRIEDKTDASLADISSIKSSLGNNTSATNSHTGMLSELKDQMKDLKNEVIKINSWKDGQINYQQKVLKDVKDLQDIVDPLHKEYIERGKKKEQTESQFSKIRWNVFEKLLILVAGATLVSLPDIIKIIYENLPK